MLEISEPANNLESLTEINAKSAISTKIVNNEIQILFEKNKDKRLPIASLTKLMTALIVFEKYDLNQKVVVSARSMSEMGEQGNLRAGEVLSVKNCQYYVGTDSSRCQ